MRNDLLIIHLKNRFLNKSIQRLYSRNSIKIFEKNYVPSFYSQRFYDWTEANNKYYKISRTENVKLWIFLGSVTFSILFTHIYLQKIKNIEIHRLNMEMPPIRWKKFVNEYLEKNQVASYRSIKN